MSPADIWMPRSIRFAFGEPIIELVVLKSIPGGFISDLDFAQGEQSITVPLGDLILGDDLLAPDGLIFHLPRSGSTALARAIGSLNGCSCYFEPQAINDLFSYKLISGKFDPKWLRTLMALYVRCYRKPDVRLILKLSSWLTLYAEEIEDAFPHSPIVFCYRNPVEVLVQILARHPGWLEKKGRKFLLRKINKSNFNGGDAEFSAYMLGAFCQNILRVKGPVMLASQHNLVKLTLSRIMPGLSLNISNSARKIILDVLSQDSEHWKGDVLYQPDSIELLNESSDEIEFLATNLVSPTLRIIEEELN